jgi:hypothetical protein
MFPEESDDLHSVCVEGESLRFVGGMRYNARGGTFSGGPRLSWPLAVLEVQSDNVRVAPRRLSRWLPRQFRRPIEMALADITAVETDFGITGGIRFRTTGPGDGTVFWPMRNKTAVIEALRDAGLDVDRRLLPHRRHPS